MPRRFTTTEKWTQDKWFKGLSAPAKLLFLYLCESCDIAGIWEIDLEDAAYRIGLNIEIVEQAFKDIEHCYVTDGDYILLVNFLYYQGNMPLNPKNNAHKGALDRLNHHLPLWEMVKERWHQKGYVVLKGQLF